MTKRIQLSSALRKTTKVINNQVRQTADLSVNLLKKLYDWIMQWREGDIYKWPYIQLPSRFKYRNRTQVLFSQALNFQAHAIISDSKNPDNLNTPLQKTRRSKIRLSDYRNKKNVLLIFLPGVLSTIPRHLYKTLLILNNSFNVFEKNNTEIILVVQSFSIEIRWLLNVKQKNGGLQNLRFPIVCDPWGLLTNSYSGSDQKQPPKITTYSCYFIDKNGSIRYNASFDKQIKFNLIQILSLIKDLKE